MLGSAMFTMVSSSTSMSCAVAMTSSARPRRRLAAGGAAVPRRECCTASLTDMTVSPSSVSAGRLAGGGPDVQGGVLRRPLVAVGGQQRRRELADDRLHGLRAGAVEQTGPVPGRVVAEPVGMDGGEAGPFRRRQRGVDQRQPGGLLVGQV